MHKRLVLQVSGAGLAFGTASALADFAHGRWWQLLHTNTFAPIPIFVLGLVGGAAGVWALLSLVVARIVDRSTRSALHAAAAAALFLLLAVTGYYLVAPLIDAQQGWYPLSTVAFWLAVAFVIGVVTGLAAQGLRRTARLWQKALTGGLVASYVLLDCLSLVDRARSNGLVPQALAVGVLYTLVVMGCLLRVFAGQRVVQSKSTS